MLGQHQECNAWNAALYGLGRGELYAASVIPNSSAVPAKAKSSYCVYIAMHDRKLYILEASAPEEEPEPGIFTHSMGYLDKDGKRIRYTETVYSNSYHGLGVYPRPGYRVSGEQ